MTNRTVGVAILLALLGGFPLLALLPNQPAAVRIAEVSLLWWYGGAAAPLAGWLAAVLLLARSRSRPPGPR